MSQLAKRALQNLSQVSTADAARYKSAIAKPRCCQACGQIIPPIIGALDNMRVKKRIYEFIARNPQGVSRGEIMDAVYADDPNGGPEWANTISVHVLRINKLLQCEGVRICSTRGPHAVYRLGRL